MNEMIPAGTRISFLRHFPDTSYWSTFIASLTGQDLYDWSIFSPKAFGARPPSLYPDHPFEI